MGKYDDIINLPHPVSKNHRQMSNLDRAAQFAPFAALTGYEDLIKETARNVKQKISISEDKANEISYKLKYLLNNKDIEATFVYFEKDPKKSGGSYIEVKTSNIKIDEYHKRISIDGKYVKFIDLFDIKLEEDNYFND